MYISEVQIDNFRLFKNLSLALNSGLNVIVGENNSGKTALIDAIRSTLDTTSAEWTRLSEADFHADTTSLRIRLKFDGITSAQAHVFVEHLTHEPVGEDRRKSVLYVNLLANLTDHLRRGFRYIRTELRSGEDAEGPLIVREIRDYLSATYLRPLRDAEAELSAGRGSRLAQILSSSREMRVRANFEKLLNDFITANREAKDNPGVSATRGSIAGHFENLTFEEDKQRFNLAVQILGSQELAQMSEPEKSRAFQDILARLSLVLDEKRPHQGLGYNNVLFMATELILLEQETGEFPLLLIEEPEAHLHPQLQMKFLRFIREEFSTTEEPKLQTILTTHSPNLASKAPLDSIIIMSEGQPYPMRKGMTKLEGDDYEFLEKFLDVTKSNLFFAKAVLIVEGDAENILVPTIASLLGRPLEDYGVSVVNVGNTAYARYAKIFVRAEKDDNPAEWMPVKVACLRDLDLWPEKADAARFPDLGFKEVTNRNSRFWERHADESGQAVGTDPDVKRTRLENFASETEDPVEGSGGEATDSASGEPERVTTQNVKVCVSNKWTFEYCLALYGLSQLTYEALMGNTDGFKELPEDPEEKAIRLYGMIESRAAAKTDVAYRLVPILEREFGGKGRRQRLKAKLPPYLLDALEHVTGPWPDDLDADTPEGQDDRPEVPATNEPPMNDQGEAGGATPA